MSALQSINQYYALILLIYFLIATNSICQHMDKKLLQPFLPKLMESMISLLSISSNNVLTLLLETILVLIQVLVL